MFNFYILFAVKLKVLLIVLFGNRTGNESLYCFVPRFECRRRRRVCFEGKNDESTKSLRFQLRRIESRYCMFFFFFF